MARDVYYKTVTYTDTADNNALKPAQDVEVTVYLAGTTTMAQVYGSRNPADVTPLPNPLTTDADGSVEFWGEYGSYDVLFHDTVVPARIGDKTIGWEATSGSDRGLPTVKIAGDGQLQFSSVDAMHKRQFAPLGFVGSWWRPASTYDAGAGAGNPPPGWEVCDGRVLVQADHDFGPIGSITLPDLRNKFILGANIANADGAAGTSADAAANAPGIRGVGGSHTHFHSVPAHYHSSRGAGATLSASGGSHGHTTGGQSADHTHALHNYLVLAVSGYSQDGTYGNFGFGITNVVAEPATYGASVSHTHAVNGATHSHPTTEFSGLVGTVTGGLNGDAAFNSGSSDARPGHVGLLQIMKVRRA